MGPSRSMRLIMLGVCVILTLACSINWGTEPTQVQFTAPPTKPIPTNTQPIPTVKPTDTPVPTPIPTKGPAIIDDDFSTDTGRFKCDNCVVSGGGLTVGPFAMVDSWAPFVAMCSDCGSHPNYKMSVQTWYAAGNSNRGFGLVVRREKKFMYLVAMSSWQLYNVFEFDQTAGGGAGYRSMIGNWSKGGLGAGRAVHFIDIQMMNGSMTLTINKDFTRTFELPGGSGEVGLWVGSWETSASFDNFHYEELP